MEAVLADAVAVALRMDPSDDGYMDAVFALRRAGATAASLAELVDAPDPRLRAFASYVLRAPSTEQERESILRRLRSLLAREEEPLVLAALALAFNELAPPDLVDLALPLATNGDADVRCSVAVALGGSRDPRALEAMIRLSRDSDEDVRNWATFGLGSQLGSPGENLLDTEPIRAALHERLDDAHAETRAEATLGLALRGDLRCIPRICQELQAGTDWDQYVEAAYRLASRELCAPLRKFIAALDDEGRAHYAHRSRVRLDAAVAACCGADESRV